MITKTKTKNSELSEFFGLEELPNSSDLNKRKLIEMAKNGEDKPGCLTKDGRRLYSYTCKFFTSYDESFTKLIYKLRPDWFLKSSDIMKQKLIKMAKDGKNRPHNRTKEGAAIRRYLDKKSSSYCEEFSILIKKLRPDWFVKPSDAMKQKLIMMAKSGKDRPKKNTKEGRALQRYMHHKNYCCKSFVKIIKELAPNWFKEKRTVEEKILKVIQENPGIMAGGLYKVTFGNINSNDLNKGLEKLRKANMIHFKLVDSTAGRCSQQWYSSSQTKEKKEISDIWVSLQDIQEEIQKHFNKRNSLIKIKKMIKTKLKLSLKL